MRIFTCALCDAIIHESSPDGIALESRIHHEQHHPGALAVQFTEWRPTIFNTPRADVLGEIDQERTRQIQLGYDTRHDAEHGAAHVLQILIDKVKDTIRSTSNAEARPRLIKVAAVAVAAIEAIDEAAQPRPQGPPAHTFDKPGEEICPCCRERSLDPNRYNPDEDDDQ